MHPVLFGLPPFNLLGMRIGPLTLHTYGFLLAVAFLVSLWVAGREARRAGLDATRVSDLAIYVLIAGLLGAKLMLLAVDWSYFSQHPRDLLSILQSGGVFYGGLIGALPVAWYFARRYDLDGWRTADTMAPAVVIGQSIGRLGCLMAGCCHGLPASVPWAVTFSSDYAARTVGTPLHTPLHPTQVYESIACLLIFLFLVFLAPRKRFHGQVVVTYVLLYSLARFTIEFFRGDSIRGFIRFTDRLALSTSQVIGVLLVLCVAAVLPHLLKTQRVAAAA